MKEIIAPVDKSLLIKELTQDLFLRDVNFGDNLIYIVDHKSAPNVILEIGRLRELTFRAAGGGTGKELDLDEFDLCENAYKQLIVWNPEAKEIVGGYRYIHCKNVIGEDGKVDLATTELFHFSSQFVNDYLPFTIELGRSFVQPEYQPSANNRKGLFSLDNLWDGLGALFIINPDVKYFFGKITMYNHYNAESRDLILYFLKH